MTKSELIAKVQVEAGLASRKQAEEAVNAVFAGITAAMAEGDKVAVAGFGTFEVRERGARTGRNPRTGETIEIAGGKVPAFKAGKALKDAVAE